MARRECTIMSTLRAVWKQWTCVPGLCVQKLILYMFYKAIFPIGEFRGMSEYAMPFRNGVVRWIQNNHLAPCRAGVRLLELSFFLLFVHCWDGVRLQFTIFIQVSFRYVCSTVWFLVLYLVGLISRYWIDVFKSRFNISTNSVQVEEYSEAWERLHMKTWIIILCVSQPQVRSHGTY